MNNKSEGNTENKFTKSGVTVSVIVLMSVALSACVVAPSQPIGYRMTNSVLPTYVNGEYVGMQSSGYVPPIQAPALGDTQLTTAMTAPSAFSASQPTYQPTNEPANQPPTVVQQVPMYTQPPVSPVVYVQNPAPVYSYPYNPYYYPTYVDPWYGPGAGLAVGLGIGIGFSSYRGCCWHGGRGWHRRGWRR